MPGGGIGTNAGAILTTNPVDLNFLVAALQRSGISFAGAQQFARGEIVANPTERKALAAMLNELLRR